MAGLVLIGYGSGSWHALWWSSRAWRSSGRLATGRRLQTELFLALDLHHLAVVHGDFHRAITQTMEGIVDLALQTGFVLAGNTA